MLSLQLKSGEYITIGDDVAVQIFKESGSSGFRVAVKAPKEVPILRGTVRERDGKLRPDGLHDKRPTRPSARIQNAKKLEQYALRKEQQIKARETTLDAIEKLRSILSSLDGHTDFPSALDDIKQQIERIASAQI